MKKQIAGGAVGLAGLALVASQIFVARPWQLGIAIGLTLAFLGALTVVEAERRRTAEPEVPRELRQVRRYLVELAVPMAPSLASTLHELLLEEGTEPELVPDFEHEEVLVRIPVAATDSVVAERIALRVLERLGLIVDAARVLGTVR